MFYNLSNKNGTLTLSVFGESGERVITKSHPFFDTVLEYLTTNEQHDEQEITNLLDPAVFVGEVLAGVTPRLTYNTRNILLDGVPIAHVISEEIVRRINGKDNSWDRLARFILKVDENPSHAAQQGLYQWITLHGLTLTEDGDFVGHKGVLDDGTSSNTGPNNYINGVLFGEPGVAYHVPHNVGDIISKKRGDVDDNSKLACSTGLHVGSLSYARDFAPRLLTVKVNPADVVSVPSDDSEWKIRVCRYEVIALNEKGEEFNLYTYDTGPSPEEIGDWDTVASVQPFEEKPAPTGSAIADALSNPLIKDQVESILRDPEIGNTAAAKQLNDLSVITTESSVRRWRKSNGV